jgi:arginyl-tRNA synthetase
MLNSFEKYVANILFKQMSEFGYQISEQEILESLEKPKDSSHGDITYSCFSIAKQVKVAPYLIAGKLHGSLFNMLPDNEVIESVKAVGPFLNFKIKVPFLATQVLTPFLSGDALKRRPLKNEKVMIEYSQPNTHKAFHVGHVRCAALGDTLRRLLDWQGCEVVPVNYIGDEGTHVARCLWYLKNYNKENLPEKNKGEFLGKIYVAATEMFDLGILTRVPYVGVVVAKILSVVNHPVKDVWRILEVEFGNKTKTVVTASQSGAVGDYVAYASVGTKLGGRAIGITEKEGVSSEGMLCSDDDLGLGNSKEIVILDSTLPVGEQLADVFAFDSSVKPTAIIKQREWEVSQILQEIEAQKGEMYDLWITTKEWSMTEFEAIYKWLDSKFDHYFYESECGEIGKNIVEEFLAKGVFKRSEGAIGIDLTAEKLGFCILIKSDGTATYACRDLALAKIKFEKYKINRSIYVVDAGQKLHFRQVFAALKAMGYPQAEKSVHYDYAQVVGKEGKMSSRKGNVVLFSQLQYMLAERINGQFLNAYRGNWTEEELTNALQAISLATIRYGMLKQDPSSQIIFDLDEWAARSGNTGPYLLYASARISTLLKDSITTNASGSQHIETKDSHKFTCLLHQSERELLLHLKEYHSILNRCAETCSPHFLAGYLFDLSKNFNAFYRDCSVLNAATETLKVERLKLVQVVGAVLKHGLEMLGIATLQRM